LTQRIEHPSSLAAIAVEVVIALRAIKTPKKTGAARPHKEVNVTFPAADMS
jgi:hypothetical protein